MLQEKVSQLIGSQIQLPIAELLTSKNDRRRFGMTRYLSFKNSMHRERCTIASRSIRKCNVPGVLWHQGAPAPIISVYDQLHVISCVRGNCSLASYIPPEPQTCGLE